VGGFRKFSQAASHLAGSPLAFLVTLGVVLAWLVAGPAFHFSDKWLLVINTATSLLTFLMVFLIQATQNRDTHAVQLKLDELIRSTTDARNFFVRLEGLPDEVLKEMQAEFDALRERALRRPRDVSARGPAEDDPQ
jgi:low affinity Fe/Cu permease